MQQTLFFLVFLPVLSGILMLSFRPQNLRKHSAFLVLALGFAWSVFVFLKPSPAQAISILPEFSLVLNLDVLSRLILVFVNFFGLSIAVYSKDYLALKSSRVYFSYIVWLIAFSNLICLAGDFILFVFAWGSTLAILYAMLNLNSGKNAVKALAVVGFGDFCLILGICLYIYAVGSTQFPVSGGVVLNNPLGWSCFLLMLCASFAKAGCGPLHTWIPSAAQTTPGPIMAILPASLDKLLGIYLLARICVDLFVLNAAAMSLLLIIGGCTIMFAVAMALIQHDLRKLLSYHAISQVGYMVLGFGTGIPIGIAGGIFHMVNHAIYKSGLFLTGASVGEKRKTFELEKLGGLGVFMPVTFVTGLVFSLSISGVPPFNGFASKWMLYQGVLEGLFNTQNKLLIISYLLALIAAMFGSVLTLASFIKFIHAVFLGQDHSEDKDKVSEVPWSMGLPVIVLACACFVLGVVPKLFLKVFIMPWIPAELVFTGTWDSVLSVFLISAGLVFGIVFWLLMNKKNLRRDSQYNGGEIISENFSFPATEFYRTVEEMPLMEKVYSFLKFEPLDLYNVTQGVLKTIGSLLFILVDRVIDYLTRFIGYSCLGVSWIFRKLHTGVLDFYLAWSLLGLGVILYFLMGIK